MNNVLEYLSALSYHEKPLYRTIGLHISAISNYHVNVTATGLEPTTT